MIGVQQCSTIWKIFFVVVSLGSLVSPVASAYDETFLANSKYEVAHTLYSTDGSDEVNLYWLMGENDLYLCVEAPSTDVWVGFGLSETGGMKGADIVTYEPADNSLQDRYSTGYNMPKIDTNMDWNYDGEGSEVEETEQGKLRLFLQRSINTFDGDDYALWNDAALTTTPHRVMAAIGSSGSFSFHAKVFKGTVRFYGDQAAQGGVPSSITDITQSITLLNDNVDITTDETYYHDSKFILSDYGVTQKMHIYAIDALIDESVREHVHHFVLKGYDDADCDGGWYEEIHDIYLWAPGSTPNILPDNVGIAIGENGYKCLLLETHFDNPQGKTGRVDNSGITLYVSTTLREYDMGILQLGDPSVTLAWENGQIPTGYSKFTFECSEGFTNSFDVEEITVIEENMHMHILGDKMAMRQYGSDSTLKQSRVVEHYDFDQQGGYQASGGFTIQKGDIFEVDCYYHNTGGSASFGPGSSQEMCIEFIYYYPKQSRSQCGPMSDGSLVQAVEIECVHRDRPSSGDDTACEEQTISVLTDFSQSSYSAATTVMWVSYTTTTTAAIMFATTLISLAM